MIFVLLQRFFSFRSGCVGVDWFTFHVLTLVTWPGPSRTRSPGVERR